MKVYLAICDYGREGQQVLAVCATRDLAKRRIDEPHQCNAEDHDIQERDVEGLTDNSNGQL